MRVITICDTFVKIKPNKKVQNGVINFQLDKTWSDILIRQNLKITVRQSQTQTFKKQCAISSTVYSLPPSPNPTEGNNRTVKVIRRPATLTLSSSSSESSFCSSSSSSSGSSSSFSYNSPSPPSSPSSPPPQGP